MNFIDKTDNKAYLKNSGRFQQTYKPGLRPPLKTCELESVFLEIINEGKKNDIFGCAYRHPSITID